LKLSVAIIGPAPGDDPMAMVALLLERRISARSLSGLAQELAIHRPKAGQ
jgi:hypothetical protein